MCCQFLSVCKVKPSDYNFFFTAGSLLCIELLYMTNNIPLWWLSCVCPIFISHVMYILMPSLVDEIALHKIERFL